MASIDDSARAPAIDDQAAWNQAYDRLQNFLKTFILNDRTQVARLSLKLLDEARELHGRDPTQDPTTLTMKHAQKLLAEWLTTSLESQDKTPSQVFSSGYTALLLSQAFRTNPHAFLASPFPDDLRHAMRHTLIVTGPDLNISSMTPRALDYGPMLDLAKQTWQRWNAREILIAAVFWTGIYFIFYWWLSDLP